MIESNQTIELSVTGVAQHNGVYERLVKTVLNMVCTMRPHEAIYFPEGKNAVDILTMTMQYYICLYNLITNMYTEILSYKMWKRSIYLPKK